MGQVSSRRGTSRKNNPSLLNNFTDIRNLPPEIAVSILANLNATDLCLAACVWDDLGGDETLWKRLCYERWGYVSAYSEMTVNTFLAKPKMSYKQVYLFLDEAALSFTYAPHQAIAYLTDNHVMEENAQELAKFFNNTKAFYNKSMLKFLDDRNDILNELVNLQDYSNVFLTDGLRQFFKKIPPPKQRGEFFEKLMDKFSTRYTECNQGLGFTKDSVSVLSYSLLLLCIDLYSPHVKNKMSKREFIRNNRQIVADANRDLLGDLYDDVYLNGHIAATSLNANFKLRQPFRPYGVLFELKSWNMQSCC